MDYTLRLIVDGNSSGGTKALGSVNKALGDLDKKAKSTAGSISKSLKSMGSSMTSTGQAMSIGITAPLAALGAMAIQAGNQLNEGMASIASLGVASDRVKELKANIKDMQIEFGKSAEELTAGTYQIISAFGDSADTAAILATNLKIAAAGQATLTEAVDLTSAVTLAWGDSSLQAIQHVGDLSLKAVELGKTKLPELASAIGKVTSMTNALGISQEEMFAVFATASGVIGSTSEVATGYRAILQSLQSPTTTMTALINSLGYANGQAMIKQLGLAGSISAVSDAVKKGGGNWQPYIGQIEGANLATALSGNLADKFATSQEAMKNALGKTTEAFKAYTQGQNAAGFAMEQAKQKFKVMLENINDGLGPALLAFSSLISPLVDKLLALTKTFSTLDAGTQKWIVGIAAGAAAIGPLLIVVGSLATGIGAAIPVLTAMGGALTALTGPIGLVVVGLGALVYFNWDNIKAFVSEGLGRISAAAPLASAALSELWGHLTNANSTILQSTTGIRDFVTALTGSQQAGIDAATWVAELGGKIGSAQRAFALAGGGVDGFAAALGKLTGIDFGPILDKVKSIAGLFQSALAPLRASFQTMLGGLSGLSPQLAALGVAFQKLFIAAQPALTALAQLIGITLGVTAIAAINLLTAAFQNIVPILSASISQITALINLIATTIQGMTQIVTSLLHGDFAGAWEGAKTIVGGFATYIQTTLANLDTVVGSLLNIIATTISGTLANLGFTELSLQIDTIKAKVTTGWLSIKDNVTVSVAAFHWSDYVKPLADWGTFIAHLDWNGYVTTLSSWSQFVGKLAWTAFIADLEWFDWISSISWTDFIPSITWSSFVPSFKWAEFIRGIDFTAWVPVFPGWTELLSSLGFGAPASSATTNSTDYTSTGSIGNAAGTNFWRGGLSWVGERGAELVNLPRSAQVYSHGQSMAMAGAGGGGGNITINAAIHTPIDIEKLAYRVSQIQQRRGR